MPTYHRIDNLKAAVTKIGFPKEYTDNYMALAHHYQFEPVSIQPGTYIITKTEEIARKITP